MLAMMLNTRAAGSSPPAGPEIGTKTFFTDDRANDGWSWADLRGTSNVDGTYGRWYSYDGTSHMWKTFGVLGASNLGIGIGTYSNTQYKIAYEGSGGRSIELHAHSFGDGYTTGHAYTITVRVDGVVVGTAGVPGPGDVFDSRSTIQIQRLVAGTYNIVANGTTYFTVNDSREFNKMRVWFDRSWAGYGVYGVSQMSWYVA